MNNKSCTPYDTFSLQHFRNSRIAHCY